MLKGSIPPFQERLALLIGSSPALLVELFPHHLRCSGLSIGFNLSQSVFGGTVPLVAVLLISWTGNVLAPGGYVTLAALISAITVMRTREPKPQLA
jgi:MHS family proline/betaine transporter-like MFS transporter